MTKREGLGPLEAINQIIRDNRVDDYASPNRELGMQPIAFSKGASEWRWEQQPAATLNPFGLVQGGYLAVFIDELLATAVASVLGQGEWAVTAETKLSYIRAVKPSEVLGQGRVLRRSAHLAFLEAEIRTEDGRTAVFATSTWSIAGSE